MTRNRLGLFRRLLPLVLASLATPAPAADAARGGQLYEQRCGACHSLDANRVGPMHRGVFGRRAGTVAGYDYSGALSHATIVWNDQTLEAWLRDPEALIPGQRMGYRVAEATDRADLIAYLRQVSGQ